MIWAMFPWSVNQVEPEPLYASLRRPGEDWICSYAKEWKWKMKMAAPHADRHMGTTARLCGFADD
jgi:hypothetical protein